MILASRFQCKIELFSSGSLRDIINDEFTKICQNWGILRVVKISQSGGKFLVFWRALGNFQFLRRKIGQTFYKYETFFNYLAFLDTKIRSSCHGSE